LAARFGIWLVYVADAVRVSAKSEVMSDSLADSQGAPIAKRDIGVRFGCRKPRQACVTFPQQFGCQQTYVATKVLT
jgi:hypothetical protein